MDAEHPIDHEPRRSRINLDAVTPHWITPDEVERVVSTEHDALTSEADWIASHQRAVEAMLASPGWEDKTATDVWQYAQADILSWERGIRELLAHIPELYPVAMTAAAERLGAWLPDWDAPETTIEFGLFRRADFRIDGETVYVDLGRLARADDVAATLTAGLTHELTHRWFHQGEVPKKSVPVWFQQKLVNEGLAVVVADQSIAAHHRLTPERSAQLATSSIAQVRDLLSRGQALTRDEADPLFKNMGAGYTAGEILVRDALEQLGPEAFRETLPAARADAALILRNSRVAADLLV